ncbi:hypothetical protein FQA39_LY02444 [Lamprigera yunnana]|nr:hypothetical protein FQA39_LY02444 [Lamprigera yunnana]
MSHSLKNASFAVKNSSIRQRAKDLKWAHDQCAGVDEDDDDFTCDLCLSHTKTYGVKKQLRLDPLPDEFSSRFSLAQCVTNVSKIFFGKGEVVLVSLPVNEVSKTQVSAVLLDRLLFKELFNSAHLSVIIKKTRNSRKDENYQKTVDNYVIQVRKVGELSQNLEMLQGYSSWNPHAKFLIISVTIYEDNELSAISIIQQLRQSKILNAVLLLPNKENTAIFDVYTWFPFEDGKCGDNFTKVHMIDSCTYGFIEKGNDWFSNKIPRNLNGCPIRVRVIVWPPFILPPVRKIPNSTDQYIFDDGIEICILNTMAEMANFSIIYSLSNEIQDWGSIYLNGTATGALLAVKKETVDIAVSSYSASVESTLHFDTIPYPIPESLKWCVPRADLIPPWKYVISVLKPETLFGIVVLFILVSMCLWRLSYFQNNESNIYKTLSSTMQNIFATMLNVAIKTAPKSNILRLTFLLWIFFSLHMNLIYQTFLMKSFAQPQFEDQIETIEDILKNNLHMGFVPTAKRFYKNNNDSNSLVILEKWQDCPNIHTCLQNTAFKKNSATCIPYQFLRYVYKNYSDPIGKSLLYCFKNNIVTYPLQMVLRKGFPFKEYYTDLVAWICDSGLIDHWKKRIYKYVQPLTLSEVKKNEAEEDEEFTREFYDGSFPVSTGAQYRMLLAILVYVANGVGIHLKELSDKF